MWQLQVDNAMMEAVRTRAAAQTEFLFITYLVNVASEYCDHIVPNSDGFSSSRPP